VSLRCEGLFEFEEGDLGVFIFVEAIDKQLQVFCRHLQAVLHHETLDISSCDLSREVLVKGSERRVNVESGSLEQLLFYLFHLLLDTHH